MAYDGTNFSGFQRQPPHERTIEGGVLTKVVNKMAKDPPQPAIEVFGSGRTDAGVHALAQTAHFDFPIDIPAENMFKALNSMIPLDMQIKKAEIVEPDFHARYDVSGKRYLYRLDLGQFKNPFKRNYTGHWKYPVDMELLNQALEQLVGEHDFSSFVASGSSAKSNVRTIYEATAHMDEANQELQIEFYGNGFLYNMVRILVGVAVEIGSGFRPVADVQRLFEVKDRNEARRTMPASGLYLKRVYYEGDDPQHPVKLPKYQR